MFKFVSALGVGVAGVLGFLFAAALVFAPVRPSATPAGPVLEASAAVPAPPVAAPTVPAIRDVTRQPKPLGPPPAAVAANPPAAVAANLPVAVAANPPAPTVAPALRPTLAETPEVKRPLVQPAALPAAEPAPRGEPTPEPAVVIPAAADDLETGAIAAETADVSPAPRYGKGKAGCTKYRTYDPDTQTFRGFDGKIHSCRPL